MGHDWDRTAAQFEKARGRIRIRKRPVVSAEWRLQKRQAIMSAILDNARDESEEAAAAAPAAAPHASGAHAGKLESCALPGLESAAATLGLQHCALFQRRGVA